MRRQQATTTSGLDIARSIFQAYGVPAVGQVVPIDCQSVVMFFWSFRNCRFVVCVVARASAHIDRWNLRRLAIVAVRCPATFSVLG
jgi:hypothetical protein